jgi:hypothetical protein
VPLIMVLIIIGGVLVGVSFGVRKSGGGSGDQSATNSAVPTSRLSTPAPSLSAQPSP